MMTVLTALFLVLVATIGAAVLTLLYAIIAIIKIFMKGL